MTPKIYLKKNEERRIKAGHFWVFSNEIAKIEGEAANGDIAELYDWRGNFSGKGFYNKNSLIAVRLLALKEKQNFYEYAREKILSVLNLRKTFYPARNSFRLLFSESDFMPGLIIDKYNDTFVLQIYSAGMEKNIESVIQILKDELKAKNIFTRNESHFRKLEGLPEEDKIYFGEMGTELIDDGAIKYNIDFSSAHKTGFYFDQTDNRFFAERFVDNKNVLDAFCSSGGFGLHAIRAGAKKVTFVDSSAAEIHSAQANYKLNNLSAEAEFVVEDVFDFLKAKNQSGELYDIVMIDPPAFAKSRKSVPTALKGYEKLNNLALRLIKPGGYLVTSSCSHHVSRKDFIDAILKAALKAGVSLRLLHYTGAAMDHPQLPAMEETAYLKFAVFYLS